MVVNRRQFLVGGLVSGAVAIAGCSGSGSREEVLDNRARVNEDEYKYWSFSLDQSATLEYEFTVRSGPEVDIFVVTDEEFNEFENRNRFRGFSSSGTGGSDSTDLGEGDYKFVVDNTNAGNVSPPSNLDDDVAEVEVKAYLS